jgi:hypothetical protein
MGADDCRNLRSGMDLMQKQLTEFTTLQAELLEKYQKYVAEDFVNQSDGVLDELSHGSAIKVVYAQKRLKEAIETKQMSMLSSKSEYCTKCGGAIQPLEKAVFCERCPTDPGCSPAKK